MTTGTQALTAAPGEILIRAPRRSDGRMIRALIGRCPPLDANSHYCNLLQCTHFADTSAIAERGREVAGFASAYLVPGSADHTLFIWQVAVAPEFRGRKIATRLIRSVLARPACAAVRWLDATVGPHNEASRMLFEGLAQELCTRTRHETMFDKDLDFDGQHDSEIRLRIGPIFRNAVRPPLVIQEEAL